MTARGVAQRAALRVPAGIRRGLPRSLRDAVRRRVGPFAPWESAFSEEPPVPSPGEMAGPPAFVGIGVQKAGTSWWFELITSHPDVVRRPEIHKERHYFARFATDEFTPEAARAYHAWFPHPEGMIAGEWTPDYAYQPWVAPLLSLAAPDARLLMIVRDPVARFVSGLAHSGVEGASHLGSVTAEAFDRGLYASALRRFMAHFDRDQLLVLQYERCVADPAGQLKRTYGFLGLDDGFRPGNLERSIGPTRTPKVALDIEAHRRLADLYRPAVAELADLVSDLDIGLWPDFSD